MFAQTPCLHLRGEGDRATGSRKRAHAFLGFREGAVEGEL